MARKIKRKNKEVKPVTAKKAVRAKSYESHYLALFLIAFLLLEGTLFSITHTSDWQQGLAVLDMSSAVSQTVSDAQVVFEPLTAAITGVNDFYSQASTQMAMLLDMSGTNPFGDVMTVASGVNDFYAQASTQMAQVLDLSSVTSWPTVVAGASISAY